MLQPQQTKPGANNQVHKEDDEKQSKDSQLGIFICIFAQQMDQRFLTASSHFYLYPLHPKRDHLALS